MKRNCLNERPGVRTTAEASFGATDKIKVTAKISTNPSDEPIEQDIARYSLGASLKRKVRPHIEFMITSTRETRADKADVEVTFDSIASFSPSITDLRVVTSSYLSHYETVRNPAKASLKTQLEI